MKKLVINNIIIISVIFLLITAVFLIFTADFQKSAREQYGAVSVSKVNTVKEYTEAAIKKGIEDVNSLTGGGTAPEGYFAAAHTTDELNHENDGAVTLNTADGEKECTFKDRMYEVVKSKTFGFFYTDTLFKDFGENISLVCFIKQTEDGVILLFRHSEELLGENYVFDFDNVMLVSPSGAVITDYYGRKRGSALSGESFWEELSGGGGLTGAEFENSSVLMCYTGFDDAGEYKVAAYIENSRYEAYISGVVRKLAIAVGAVTAAAGLLAALLVLAYVRHYNALLFINKGKTLYIVYVNNMGVMKKGNAAYTREFETLKIYDNILDACLPSFRVLQDCLPIIVRLKNRAGEEKYIIFFIVKTFRGYKLIGENATPIMTTYIESLKEVRKNENLNMFNMRQFYDDYRSARKALRENNGLYVLFEIRNITKYRSMFGEDFYNDLLKKYAEILKDASGGYGNIYYFNYETFVLLITESKKAAQFKEKFKDFMIKVNIPLQIGKSLIKADCVAGAVDIKGEYKEKTIKELNSLADYSLEKAYELKKFYEIYDENKGNYYISYGKKREIAKSIIESNMLELYFQPQYSIVRNKITGFEALIRLKGSYAKEIPISEFIEIAERSGYMIALGDYVFNKAFEFAKKIEKTGITVSVNISPVQLFETGFVKGFLEKFEQYDVSKESIVLEITETFFMTSFNEAITKLMVLKDGGVKIHLDDFGVAYSSMLYLKRLPITTIKIDKAFISDIIGNDYSRIICGKLIELASELNLNLIAEGVETQEQLELLRQLGCRIIQGYYISSAVPEEKAMQLIEKYNGRM